MRRLCRWAIWYFRGIPECERSLRCVVGGLPAALREPDRTIEAGRSGHGALCRSSRSSRTARRQCEARASGNGQVESGAERVWKAPENASSFDADIRQGIASGHAGYIVNAERSDTVKSRPEALLHCLGKRIRRCDHPHKTEVTLAVHRFRRAVVSVDPGWNGLHRCLVDRRAVVTRLPLPGQRLRDPAP